jgi:alcohol dehydrogenase class IV
MIQSVALPRIVEIGGGARHRLPAVLDQIACQRPLVVTDATMRSLGVADEIVGILRSAGRLPELIEIPAGEPSEIGLQAGLERVRKNRGDGGCDGLVALGGGSAIDAAKALAVLAKRGGNVAAMAVPTINNAPGLPVIAIPTTAGTGSEATRFTIIGVETPDGEARKLLCAGLAFLPVAAIVDYELTLGLPPRITADTGIDAMTHAIEAYVSRRAGPFSDHAALAALKLIAPNLRRVYTDGTDREAREAVMFGATLAGIAFSNASVALVHGMSRPLGAGFGVPHGLSNAMLLPTVTAFSLESARERYASCAAAMGLDDGDALVPWLRELNRDLAVPGPEAWGITASDFECVLATMAEQALASGSPANNPRLADRDTIVDLYRRMWQDQEQYA